MPTTANGYRYPAASASPNVPLDIQNLAQDVNDKALPVFTPGRIYAYKTSDQLTPAASLTTPFILVLNGTTGTAQNISLNTGTGVMTIGAGAGGEYTVSGAVNIAEAGPSRVFATVYVNGAEVLRGLDIINRGAISGDVVGSTVSGPLTLAAGDQITLRALHTGSAGAGVVAPNGVFVNWLMLRRIA